MASHQEGSIFSQKERRILRYIILFVLVTRIILVFRSEPRIYSRPYTEDTFFLFSCADHFAHGEGFSVDGIHSTNGVQPLIVVIYAPLFLIAGSDKLLALKLGFILIAIFDCLSVVFLARIVRLLQKKPEEESLPWTSPPIIACILWAGLYSIFVRTGNGLETGLYSLLLLISLYYYIILLQKRSNSERVTFMQWIVFGIILGLTVLARIDAAFLVVSIACYEIYKFRSKGVINGIVISWSAFIISSPWWWYNFHSFGSLMPQSGVSESLNTVISVNLIAAVSSFADILTIFYGLPNYAFPSWFLILWSTVIIISVMMIVGKYEILRYLKTSYSLSALLPFLLFSGGLAVYYVAFFNAPYFFPRYFHPFRIIYLICFVCALPELLKLAKLYSKKGRNFLRISLLIFGSCALIFSVWKYSVFFTREQYTDYYLAGKWAFAHPHDRVGMNQSGTAEYISANVVNLDGKVNFAALQARCDGEIGAYIEKQKLDYIVDCSTFSRDLVNAAEKYGGQFEKIDSVGLFIIYRRVKK